MPARAKKKYNVYCETTVFTDAESHLASRQFLGSTWAVSRAQAANNVSHRLGIRLFSDRQLSSQVAESCDVVAYLAEEDK